MQFRNYFTNDNQWIFSPNTSIGEVSQYFPDMRTFQFQGRFISDELISQIEGIESHFSSVESSLDDLTDFLMTKMLPIKKWVHSRDQYAENTALFALNIGIIPFENPDGSKGRSLSYSFQIFRNQSMIDLVKHGSWLDDQVSGFEEINYYFARTEDLLNFRHLQTGLAKKPSDVFRLAQPYIDDLNNQEIIIRRIEAEKSPSFLAINLTADFDNWEKSGAAQLDKINGFDVQSKISGLFKHVSNKQLAELKHKADIFKNLQQIKKETADPNNYEAYESVRNAQIKLPKKYATNEPASVKRTLASALSLIGTPFAWGGRDEKGFDIPGFIEYLRAISGLTALGGKVYIQAAKLRELGKQKANLSKSLPGDLLFWGQRGAEFQVGLYVGGGQYIGLKGPDSKLAIQAISGLPTAYKGIF
ncbi:NlpC/P60 family protein [Oenococcus sicerae]|uniref:NlpC/P60 family protein n=1 Tax=Oenococcus sicerae TaxID=2203724 RepID=UPI0039E83BBF